MLLFAGSGMGGGTAGPAVTFIPPIGRKIGIERLDGPDANMPTGITGVSA